MLKGKVAIVTGSTSGIGYGIARALAAQGADIMLNGFGDAGEIEAIRTGIATGHGVRAEYDDADMSDGDAVRRLVRMTIETMGRLDILVNNAGIAIQGHRVDDPELDGERYNRQWQVNVLGTIAITRAAAPKLSDGGRILFTGSLLGSHVPFPGVADYAGTKWALAGYAKGIARDLGRRNITVNVVQPGIMPTDMAAEVAGQLPQRDAILDMHPIRRIAGLEEVAETICFLAGPAAGYINGQAVNIAGGFGI